MTNYTLLTGATGLVGRYLLRDLLSQDARLAVVVRPTAKQSIQERIESAMQMWDAEAGRLLPRPVCLEGDVCQPQLGLDSEAQHWVRRNCDQVLHNAAVLTFHGGGHGSEPWRTNVGGTANTLELCRSLGIRRLHYVSTAYVCGQRNGLVRESELDAGQDFRNDYERSKFQAESLVREADFLDHLTVYRPAVIAGDSRTGYTNQYHGLYLYLRLMSLLVPQQECDPGGRHYTPIRLPMTGEERRNIIPVDWTSRVICRIFLDASAWDETYHLVPDVHLTPRKIIDAGYRYFNSTGVEYVGYQEIEPDLSNRFETEFLANIRMYEPYTNTDPEFDTTNLKRVAGDIACPEIDDAMLHRYLEFGERDRWGKRRAPKPEIPFSAADYLSERKALLDGELPDGELPDGELLDAGQGVIRRVDQNAGRKNGRKAGRAVHGELKPVVVGLDIVGPGGGQWKVALRNGRLCNVEPGLPSQQPVAIRMPADRFAELCAVPGPADRRLAEFVCHESLDGAPLNRLAAALFEAVGPLRSSG